MVREGRGRWPAEWAPATFVCMFEAADVLDELNDEQRRAATHTDEPLLVLAGAGTGKTGTLVARAAWLRAQGTGASRILLLTFTRRAAAHMLARGVSRAAAPRGGLGGLVRGEVAHKRRQGLVGLDDLLLLWRAALADPAAGAALRGLFDAVLVDEYQDVNAVQAEIVRLLRPDGRGLTCVGDDAQAIYAFRGADPGHLRALAGAYPGLNVIRLVRNYRPTDSVLRLAHAARPPSDGLELELTGLRGAGPAPQLGRCHDEATQAREIAARVLDAHESGRQLREQAVLVRAAHHTALLDVQLSARGIPAVKYRRLPL